MEIKDCLFGQVRGVEDNVFRGHGVGYALPTTIPSALQPYITNQQQITWTNETGMNPLWQTPNCSNVVYDSYGNMLQQSRKIAEEVGTTFVTDLIPELTAEEYHSEIVKDYRNDYSLLCASLGFWWHIQKLMEQPDILDYDYVVFRQTDTWYHPLLTSESVEAIFNLPTVLGIDYDSIVFGTTINTKHFPTPAFIQAFFFMFNRRAISVLRRSLYRLILGEIERHYLRQNKYAQQIYGKSGVILYNLMHKMEIPVIDLHKAVDDIFCWIPDQRSPNCANYGRNERNVKQANIG